jgi:CYTH domain-containing protein
MSKYQLIERERKFLLASEQVNTTGLRQKQITDYYLSGARLRFRVVTDEEGQHYKLTQKSPADAAGEAAITTIYLNKQEFELLNIFDAVIVSKTRYLLQSGQLVIGLDHYLTETDKLWLAEVEFSSTEEMLGFELPLPRIGEVTGQPEYDGYALARRFQQIN